MTPGHTLMCENPLRNELFEDIIRSFPESVCVVDDAGRFKQWNSTFEKLLGYTAQEIAEIAVLDTVAEEHRELVQQATATAFTDGMARVESVLMSKDGTRISCLLTGVRIVLNDQPCLLEIAVDLTNLRQTEERLRASAAEYESLVASIPEVVWKSDSEGRVSFVGPGVETILGYSSAEVYQRGDSVWYDSIHVDDRQRVKQAFQSLWSEGKPYDVECRVQRKNGEWFWAHDRAVTTGEKDGIRFATALLSDITERKASEETLRKLASIVEFSEDAITVINTDGVITTWNPAAERMYGYTRAEAIGRDLSLIVPPERQAEKHAIIERIMGGQSIKSLETQRLTKAGYLIDVSLSATAIKDGTGRIAGVAAVSRDITLRKRSEEQLRLQSAALESAANGIVITDRLGTIIWANDAVTTMTGYSKEELLGKNPRVLKSGNQPESYYANLWSTISSGKVWRGELVNRRKDGTTYLQEMTITPVTQQSRGTTTTHFIAIKQDITERRRAEELLQHRKAMLNATGEMAKVGGWELDLGTHELTWTREVYRIHEVEKGFAPNLERAIGFYTPESRPLIEQAMKRAIDHGEPFDLELEIETAKKKRLWVKAVGKIRTVNAASRKLFGTFQDITERKRAEETEHNLNRKLRAISRCNLVLMRATDEQTLLNDICRIVCDEAGYRMVWVGYAQHDEAKTVRPVAWAGIEDGYLATANVSWADTERGRGPGGTAIRSRVRVYVQDFATAPEVAPWRENALQRGYRSNLVVPLNDDNANTFGALAIYSAEPNAFTPDEIALLEELAHNLAFGITVLRARVQHQQAEETLHKAEEKYFRIFNEAVVGIFQSTPDGRFLSVNPELARIYGYASPAELMANCTDIAYQTFVDPSKRDLFKGTLEEKGSVNNLEYQAYRKDGSKMWLLENARAVRNSSGATLYYEGTVADITDRKVAEERVQYLAYYDALTDLPNRALLADRLSTAVAGARRQKDKVALLFLDLDRFKSINDSFGHSFGDLVLQDVAKRLKRRTREQDTVARLGGDEFLIVLNNVKDISDVAVAAKRFMDAMTAEFVVQGHSLSITCSLGISIFPEHGMDVETLVKNADAAMYSAKENGRNNFQFFAEEMTAQVVERLTLESSLRPALDKKQLFLVYQPQMDIATGKIVGLEALLRWQHPELGLVPPDKFIRIAENSGLILPIGEWVLRTACSQARKWQDEGLSAVRVAVNVSAVQFRQPDFCAIIGRVLHETGLAPQYLELELTESLLLSSADMTLSVIRELSALGVTLAIDDFGTGYSNFGYLKQFRVSRLKIDRSFINDVAVNPDDAAIANAIISMAKSMSLKVIAEGVENEAQMSFLRAHLCDEIQGYYFSKPLTVDKVADKLRGDYHEPLVRAQASGGQSSQGNL